MSITAEEVIYKGFIKGFKPDPINLSVSQWADEFRLLSSKASSEPGKWRTDRTPYLREILDSLSSNNSIEQVVFMKGAQLGATEAGNNWLGYIVDLVPGPAMMVQPTVDMLKRLTKQRLDPMFSETPTLANKVMEKKSRDSQNTLFLKEFPGGLLLLAGANSPTGLRSAPIRYLFLDEIDGYPADCGGEGSPIKLAEARTRTFKRNRKIFLVSTPTEERTSQIEPAFLSGDQRYFFVPCPHCNEYQKLVFDNLRWEKNNPDKVFYSCCKCGEAINEGSKNTMLAAGKWIPTAETKNKKLRSYHLNSLYSPLGWYSWSDIARDWEEAQGNVLKLKGFVNTVLGETWKDKGESPEWEFLYRRKEDYQPGTIPDGVLFLTAGVDVQKDRIELEIVGWSKNLVSYSIDYVSIIGDPTLAETWDKLDAIKDKIYLNKKNKKFQIEKMAIDTGFNTQIVYNYIRNSRDSRLMAIKGMNSGALMVGQPKYIDVKNDGKTYRRGLAFYPVAVSLIKEELYSFLNLEKSVDGTTPRGYCHFPEYEAEYFKMLTAEQKKTISKRGVNVAVWEKIRNRNEALDCRVYARAAAYQFGIDRFTDEDWKTFESRLKDQELKKDIEVKKTIKRRKSDFW